MYEDIKKKFSELEEELSKTEMIANKAKLKQVSKEHAELKELIEMILELEKIEKRIKDNQEILEQSEGTELADMARDEIDELEKNRSDLKIRINEELSPADPNDKKNSIMEIRAGTGGDESALFAANLFRMYSRFSERMGWKVNILSSNRIGIGGFKEIIFSV
ncbi:MAG: PCRF domain-containing protein, partial [Gammaproteobacteria bacterium]|nr:PCRF domain-containing protein [Gammaproteobacteria bacterium]